MDSRRRASACLAAAALLTTGLLTAAPAGAHGLDATNVSERSVRTLETRILGPGHAHEHALARRAQRRIAARVRRMSPAQRRRAKLADAATVRAAASEPASEVGRWDTPFSLPIHGIHAAMLPTGKVMLWSYPFTTPGQSLRTYETRAWLWDPAAGTGSAAFDEISPPPSDGTPHAMIFCGGGSLMADGKLLAVGGTLYWPSADKPGWAGIKEVWTFDPFTEGWKRHPDMKQGRWYPSQELMPDGRTLIMSGWDEHGEHETDKDLEVFTPSSDPNGTGTVTHFPSGDRFTALYPHLFTMPSGQVLLAGPTSPDSALLTVSEDGPDGKPQDVFQWTDVPDAAWRRAGSAIQEPGSPAGSTRVTQIGGVDPSKKDATTGHVPPRVSSQTFDVSKATDDWVLRSPMSVARSHFNAVVLPDSTVVSIGGSNGETPEEGFYASWSDSRSRQIEIRDPETGQWRLGPAQAEDRAYHSTAVLLPDGRVLSSGDDRPGTRGSDTGEIYSPPYLFKGPRPVIDSAPTAVPWAKPFHVETSGPAVTRAVLMAPGVVTHGAEMHAKHVELTIAGTAGEGVNLMAPPSANVAQPGWYMLFLLTDEGVPSVARWVRLDGSAPVPTLPTPPPPTDPGPTDPGPTDPGPTNPGPTDPGPGPGPGPGIPVPTPPGLPGFGTATGVSVGSAYLTVRGGVATARIANKNVFDVPARLTVSGRGSSLRTRTSMSTALLRRETTAGIRVRLSKQMAALVQRRRRVTATLTLAVRDLNGQQRTVKRAVVLLRR
jgi:hypothetical protein